MDKLIFTIVFLVLAGSDPLAAQLPKAGGQEQVAAPSGELACGPPEERVIARTGPKHHRPQPVAPADQALVYVVRPTMSGHTNQTKLGIDGHWVGVNRGNTYFFVFLDPGVHHFCSQSENRAIASFELEAGKTYFLQQKIKFGIWKAQNSLALLDEKSGRLALAKCKLSTWQRKQ